MLTNIQYKALLRFRNTIVPAPSTGLAPVDRWLLNNGYIIAASIKYENISGVHNLFADAHTITEKGLAALDEYEQERQRTRIRYLVELAFAVLAAIIAAAILRKIGWS